MNPSLIGPRSTVRALFAALALICLAFVALPAYGQTTGITDQNVAPIPGHDYIGILNETVSPSSGKVSVQIKTPVPPGRKLTLPFGIGYSSLGNCLQESPYQSDDAAFCSGQGAGNFGPFSDGNWAFLVPQLSRFGVAATYPAQPDRSTQCLATTGYTYTDAQGSQHNLQLANVYDYYYTNKESDACQKAQYVNALSGGDAVVSAALVRAQQGQDTNTDPGVLDGSPTVADADGTTYTFDYSQWCETTSKAPDFVVGGTIVDRNGNGETITTTSGCQGGLTITDTLGRTAISANWPLLGGGGTTGTVTVAGLTQPYTLNWTKISVSGYSFNYQEVDGLLGGSCNKQSLSYLGGSPLAVTSLTLPNLKDYVFSYDPKYGTLSQIKYPTGGYVSYTWGLNPLSSTVFFNTIQGPPGCAFAYDTAAVTNRYVSFDGSTVALEQDFSYCTVWSGTSTCNAPVGGSLTWTSKTTTITTKDKVRGTSYQTVYTYAPVISQAAVNSGTIYTQIPVESTIQYYDTSGALLQTVQKGWNFYDASEMYCQLTQIGGTTGPIAGTFYVYGPGGQVTEKLEYDYGQIASLSKCAMDAGPPSGITPARETLTTYQPGFPTPSGFAGPVILDRPCKVVINNSSGSAVAETDYYYDGGATLCGGSPTAGNVTSVISKCLQSAPACSAGNPTTANVYDVDGQLTSMKDPNGNTTTYSYTDSYSGCGGNAPPSSPSDAYLTQVTYPPTNGVSHIVKYCYDYTTGLLRSSTDQNNQTTTYKYNDSLNRPTETDYPDTGKTTLAYNDTGPNPTVTTTTIATPDPTITSVSVMDGVGHPIETQLTSDPDGTDTTLTTYDGLGRVYNQYNSTRCSPPTTNCGESTWGITTYTYDALGRTCLVEPPGGTAGSGTCPTAPVSGDTTITHSGRATETTEEIGKQRITQVDGLGRLTAACEVTSTTLTVGITGSTTPAACGLDISGTGFLTSYGYDALADLTSVTQGPLNGRSFAYNSLAQLTSASNPESGTTSYTYDANGNLATKTDARSDKITYAYDADNRLTGKTYSDSTPSVTYNYDESSSHSTTLTNTIGRQSSESTAGTYTTSAIFSYDPMGRVLNNSQQAVSSYLESITYTYDLAGNMLTAFVPGAGTITNTYNGASNLSGTTTNASGPSTLISSPHYNPLGQSVSQSLGNGLNESWTYNDRGWRTGYNLANGSNSVYSYSLMQAANGNVLSSNDAVNGDWVYGYDDFNRLTSSSVTGMLYRYPQSYTYVYDRFGNRWQQNVTSGTGDSSSLAFDANNHITTTGVTYDAAGNVTNDGTNTYAYDAEGRIASVNSGTATYVYDAEGNRVGTVDSARGQISFYYDLAGHVIFEGSTGRIRMEYYVGGRHLVTYSATTVFNHPNWLGTEQYRTTTTGTSYENCVNNPFGDNMYCAGNDGDLSRVHFTGKERDSYDTDNLTNLDNFGARFYSSAMARFMRPDPTGIFAGNPFDPQQLNLYAYGRNNPLLFTDPSGLDCVYFNDAGNAAESIDHNSDSGECANNGGDWVNGYSTFSGIAYNNGTDTFTIQSWDATGSSITNYTTTASAPGSQTMENNAGAPCPGDCTEAYSQSTTNLSSPTWARISAWFHPVDITKATYHSFGEGGCDRMMFDTLGEDLSPVPTGGPGLRDLTDNLEGAAFAVGLARANNYAINQGLVKPMASTIFKSMKADAVGLGETAAEYTPGLMVAGAASHAVWNAGSAAWNGECH